MVSQAINALTRALTTDARTAASHRLTIVGGIEEPEAMKAFATYALVAGICQGVRMNLAIAAELLGSGPEFKKELQRDVESIIGADNGISNDFREDQRDPWFTECLAHALLRISRDVADLAPPGRLEALTLVHTDVRDHGLDLVGFHLEQALLGLTIAEAKASESNASNHGAATAVLFREIDAGSRDREIRGKVQLLREVLSPPQQELITPSFWHGRRTYFPIMSYSGGSSFRPARSRPTYAALAVGTDRIRLLAVPLTDYRRFFDQLADLVRALVPIVAEAGAET
jgi:hypothetical protein